MPTRAEHLDDIRARLSGKIAIVGARVWRGRVTAIPPAQLPAVCLYAPQEDSGEVEAVGTQPAYQPTHTLVVEVRVPFSDGFDIAAGAVVEQVRHILLTDQGWLKRFKPYPRFAIRQFLERRTGEEAFCGEVLTITAMDRRPTEYRPNAPMLSGVSLGIDITGDGVPEITIDMTAAGEGPAS